MRSGFCPHDHNRTTKSMEGVWMGSWAVVERGWAAKREGFRATRLTVGALNDLQMERNLTGGLPVIYQGHSANLGPFRERFYSAHETRSERGDLRVRVCLCSERTAERTGRIRTDAGFEKHADEMQMTLQKKTHP